MRFYEACISVAEQVADQMTREEKALFMETEYQDMYVYHFTLGLWIRNHCLQEKNYLYKALLILGFKNEDDMSEYLLEFTQQYLLLKRARLL